MKKHSTQTMAMALIITISACFLLMCVYFASAFNNILDFLLAVWVVVFLILLGFCITAVVAVLLYDYFNRG